MAGDNLKFAEAHMLIRKPVSEVFKSFIDPELTKNFWFTKGSSKLAIGETVTWEWEMYNFSSIIFVKDILADKKIIIEWFTTEPPTTVEFDFKTLSDGSTFVTIKHYGFNATGDDLFEVIKDSTSGFTIVLAGLKAFLEHNINLNLIADKFPKEITQHGK